MENVRQMNGSEKIYNKENVDSATEKVKEGFQELVDEGKAASAEGVKAVKASIEEKTSEAKNALDQCVNQAACYVKANPVRGMAIAAGAGLLLGTILRRKSAQ